MPAGRHQKRASLARDESGATATEYGLVAMLVSVAVIGALWLFGDALSDLYTAESEAVDRVTSGVE